MPNLQLRYIRYNINIFFKESEIMSEIMNEIIKCILERRSIRKFSSKEINKKDLDLILKAGEYAPSAESEYR